MVTNVHPIDLAGGHGNVMDAACASRRVLALVADKWAVLAIYALAGGSRRFSEVRREVGGVSQKMLTQTLRDLERHGLITRTVHAVVPPRVDYALTPLGETLIGPLTVLRDWAEAHMPEVVRAADDYDAATAGA
jgi:DNA-binding HxlR family transcriptional regulator